MPDLQAPSAPGSCGKMAFTIGNGQIAYALKRELKGENYRELLKYSQAFCAEIWLTIRPELSVAGSASRLLQRLEPDRIDGDEPMRLAQIFDATARIHRFRFTFDALAVLLDASRGLYSWQQPDLPEDLCLFRSGGQEWLVTNAHERMAYLVLTREERTALLSSLPKLARVFPS